MSINKSTTNEQIKELETAVKQEPYTDSTHTTTPNNERTRDAKPLEKGNNAKTAKRKSVKPKFFETLLRAARDSIEAGKPTTHDVILSDSLAKTPELEEWTGLDKFWEERNNAKEAKPISIPNTESYTKIKTPKINKFDTSIIAMIGDSISKDVPLNKLEMDAIQSLIGDSNLSFGEKVTLNKLLPGIRLSGKMTIPQKELFRAILHIPKSPLENRSL